MDHQQWVRWIVIAFMISILWALMSGLYFIIYKRDKSEKAVKALTFRIGLSLFLFALLFIRYFLGWWHPHGLLFPL